MLFRLKDVGTVAVDDTMDWQLDPYVSLSTMQFEGGKHEGRAGQSA